ncbi:nickel pincer cofactor biosynthesis protein LarB [Natronogracilivirga saccharolytica]|uniref:Nickel pincer cofactor biosynthesis protein LarB n=1 Tax=Natronogracilivirga saccharolytica TaxID=2812953 RepID=A0A8J7S8G5_9BACT|nr:nickel pincer cofactor biosynthesis protein LarB [Natronogracilivirga saccharolytica]MBP3192176.1 nickel pincer cofactor biosynthesis protein LarB [Natronogracilivirga saccharolytica]
MDKKKLKKLLEDVQEGSTDIDRAMEHLDDLTYKNLDFAKIDNHREIRTGYPEVIFGQGKTPEQLREIISFMISKESNILATRVDPEVSGYVSDLSPDIQYHKLARCLTIRKKPAEKTAESIAVVTAGTGDLPVAEEACVTAEIFDNRVERFFDVGVAGVHRLYDNLDDIRKCRVVVVVAGMEGALPSLVGGLVDKPVIAVPTSIGYGANFSGLSALLGMLTSCAAGVSVVNIDNGFGAGYLAGMINKL